MLGRSLMPSSSTYRSEAMLGKYACCYPIVKSMLKDELCPDCPDELCAVIVHKFSTIKDKIATLAAAYLIKTGAIRSGSCLDLMMAYCQVFEDFLDT